MLRFVRRWALRLRLRLKLRWFGLVPMLAVAWALAECWPLARGVAQAPSDSLIGTVLSRAAIGPWVAGPARVWCLTWVSQIPERPRVLVVIDATPADTSVKPMCPNPKGGFYPLWIDSESCPPGAESPFVEYEFLIVRCSPESISRYRRREFKTKGEQ